MNSPSTPARITVLGVGNVLLSDEGVGVRVVERLSARYTFPHNVNLVDGGVLGVGLMGLISETDLLIVVDAVKNGRAPGALYRLSGEQIPRRILAKQSMHQTDLPEVLALCSLIGHTPQTVVIGVEPADITTMALDLTPTVAARLDELAAMVLSELADRGAACTPREPRPTGAVGCAS